MWPKERALPDSADHCGLLPSAFVFPRTNSAMAHPLMPLSVRPISSDLGCASRSAATRSGATGRVATSHVAEAQWRCAKGAPPRSIERASRCRSPRAGQLAHRTRRDSRTGDRSCGRSPANRPRSAKGAHLARSRRLGRGSHDESSQQATPAPYAAGGVPAYRPVMPRCECALIRRRHRVPRLARRASRPGRRLRPSAHRASRS
jgi:hypothetical protein